MMTHQRKLLLPWMILCFLLFGIVLPAHASRLSPLAEAPDWRQISQFHKTITAGEFQGLLDNVYAPRGAWKKYISIEDDHALIRTNSSEPDQAFQLQFAATPEEAVSPPRYWRPSSAMPPAPANRPLAGVRIALDPGHIGGRWAQMEERWFQIGDAPPVMEGEMALKVARLLEPRLKALGAKVSFTRRDNEPVTKTRPDRLRDEAVQALRLRGVLDSQIRQTYSGPADPNKQFSVQWQSELLFYRTAEIRRRAEIVNQRLKPDLTVCIHFNAEGWGDPEDPRLVDLNHLHLLVNGAYGADELSYDDVRYDMMVKLLNRSFHEELAVSEAVGAAMSRHMELPAYKYTGPNAIAVGSSEYIWARNLLANRQFEGPVIFLEPYVMNSKEVYDRIQAGDYEGEREIGGRSRRSIFREYADSVLEGLVAYYQKTRVR